MSDFILRQLVRDILAETDAADPGEIAGQVMARIPPRMIRVALSQALRLYVRQVISETRTAHPPVAPTAINRSAKVAAIRDGWQKRLRDRVHVGGSEWKFLADCTYEDLIAAASERRQMADRNNAWARTYDAWARLLTEHNVTTFGELPAAEQMQALGRAA